MYPSDEQPPFRRTIKKASSQAPKGHEAFLKALETAGAIVRIAMVSDPETVMKGTIRASDKYTISLKVDRDDGTHQVYVLFKHAIESFWTDPADQPHKQAA
jgi:sRNA-binding regulator protein Hfq